MTVGDFKITDRDDPGEFDQYGTDDVEVVMRLLKGILSGTQPPKVMIKSEQGWEWFPETSPLWIRDIDESHVYRIKTGNLAGNFDVTIPSVTDDSNFVLDTITNDFLEPQEFEDVIKIKPNSLPSTDAGYGQIVPDADDANKLKYIKPDGTVIDLTAAAGAGSPTNATYVTLSNNATLTNERALAAGDGVGFVDGGANGSVTPFIDRIDLARKRVGFIDDCFGYRGQSDIFSDQSSGTGANVDNFAVSETGIFGIWEIGTGTDSNGNGAVRASQSSAFTLGQGITTLEMKIKVPVLATVTEDFIVRLGFGDSVTGGSTDSAQFVYDKSTSDFWLIQCKSNNVINQVTTNVTVVTGWLRLKIVANANASSVSFFINGAEVNVSPLTTTIPDTTRFLTIHAFIKKEAGTTERTVLTDYFAFDIKLTSPR